MIKSNIFLDSIMGKKGALARMPRPDHLPDFTKPPLQEVVLGVQFEPPPNYNSVNSKDVWNLFDNEFPKVEEHSALPPTFETFGGSNPQSGIQFNIGPPPLRGRLWFISEEGNHLIQFQNDRFLLNWRKGSNNHSYPRFEGIAESFSNHLGKLKDHFLSQFSHHLEVNQAEISYINFISVTNYDQIGKWFSMWDNKKLNIEGLTINFSEVIVDENGTAFARLSQVLESVVTSNGKDKGFRLSLSFRGRPPGKDKESSMKFFNIGRDKIVTRFNEITTDEAHRIWGKK